jgi:hypothetical protein
VSQDRFTGWPIAFALLAGLTLFTSLAGAAELVDIQVSNTDNQYFLESESVLKASVPSVFKVLLDYENFTKLSSVYEESRYLESGPDGAPRVYTLAQGCMLFVCRSVEKVERLETRFNRRIVATVIPEYSNLEQGVTEWLLTADGENTRLVYRMELTPKFWVPPLIGPPIIRYVLAKGGEEALQRLEAAANELDLAHSSTD